MNPYEQKSKRLLSKILKENGWGLDNVKTKQLLSFEPYAIDIHKMTLRDGFVSSRLRDITTGQYLIKQIIIPALLNEHEVIINSYFHDYSDNIVNPNNYVFFYMISKDPSMKWRNYMIQEAIDL